MDTAIPGIAAAVGVAIALAVVMPRLVKGQRRKAERLEGLLRDRGPMTLDEIAKALGTGVFAKGYLMQALDGMVRDGKLEKTPAPAGTPALRLARDARYGLRPAT